MRHTLCVALLLITPGLASAAPASSFTAEDTARVRDMLEDIVEAVSQHYHPLARIDAGFRRRVDATGKLLATARSNNDANALIGDLLLGLDPRIRFYPPARSVRVDCGWDWRIIGDAAYVTHLDADSDALKKGLKIGDKILTIDGAPLTRASAQEVYYAMYTLVPRPGRRVLVQSGGDVPRTLDLAATQRPPFETRTTYRDDMAVVERVLTSLQKQRIKEFRDLSNHLHRVGPVLVWHAQELHRDTAAVAEGLKAARNATGLILDLRGRYVMEYDTVLRLLDGLFAEGFDVGLIERQGLDKHLRVSGRADAFPGTVLVLVDSGTANYAELAAHVIQQKQRGIIIGDRTMGRIFEHKGIGYLRGMTVDFNVASVVVPAGDIKPADGTMLDGKGVAPDLRLLPGPADLAGHRDVVLARALGMLKQTVPPEEAYGFFRTEPDDDESD